MQSCCEIVLDCLAFHYLPPAFYPDGIAVSAQGSQLQAPSHMWRTLQISPRPPRRFDTFSNDSRGRLPGPRHLTDSQDFRSVTATTAPPPMAFSPTPGLTRPSGVQDLHDSASASQVGDFRTVQHLSQHLHHSAALWQALAWLFCFHCISPIWPCVYL